MKFIFIPLFLIQLSLSTFSQPVSFIKKLTGNHLENWSDAIVQGQNGHYYLSLLSQSYSPVYNRKIILHCNEWGNKVDSIKVDTLLNMVNDYQGPVFKFKNYFLYYATLRDSLHDYFYIRVFDQNLQTITEKIVDTLLPNQYILYHIENKKGNHIFLSLIKESISVWDYLLYETDSNFNLINKANTNFKDVFTSSFVEIPADSSYLITTRNWILKTNYNFSYFDTIVDRWQAGENYVGWSKTKKFNDSLYFESDVTVSAIVGSNIYDYPGFFVRTKNAEKIDTFSFPISSEQNDITQAIDFFDFTSPDTLFYCSGAFSIDPAFPDNSGIMIAKFNMNQTVYWQKYYGFDGNYWSGSISATQDGGCITLWSFYDWVMNPTNSNTHNLIMIKTDKYGNAPTGIDDNIKASDKQILVYPNPAVSMVHFQTGLYYKLQLQIYNINGQLQNEKVLLQGENSLDVSRYSSGIYFYRIIYKDRFLESGKFVKE
jgi:hypothetical protein